MHIYTDTHTIAWYVVSALRKMCIMTPQFFCMGVGVRLDLECSVYIWNAPHIYGAPHI